MDVKGLTRVDHDASNYAQRIVLLELLGLLGFIEFIESVGLLELLESQ
jgi:hypothetical protein